MKERIQKILLNEGLTPSRLADMMRVQRSSVSHILAGRNKPSMDFLTKLLQSFPAINGHWLLTGQGEMYTNGKVTTEPESTLEDQESTVNLFATDPAPESTIEESKGEKTSQDKKDLPTTPIASIPIQSNSRKIIKKIIVIYDDYSTEEIFNG